MSAHTMEEDIFTGKMDFGLWKKMLRFALPHKWKIFSVMGLGAALSVCDMVLPYLTGRIVESIKDDGAHPHLGYFMLQYAAVILTFFVCVAGFILLAGRNTVAISYDIRQTCFDKLQRLPFTYYDRKAVGWLMARMTSDCSGLSRVMAWAMLDLSWGVCALGGAVVLMLCMAWRLALVVITIAPILIFISRYYQVRLLKSSRALRKANSMTTAAFNEGIVGVKTSKSLVREAQNAREFSELTNTMYGHAVQNRALWCDAVADAVVSLRNRHGAGAAGRRDRCAAWHDAAGRAGDVFKCGVFHSVSGAAAEPDHHADTRCAGIGRAHQRSAG